MIVLLSLSLIAMFAVKRNGMAIFFANRLLVWFPRERILQDLHLE